MSYLNTKDYHIHVEGPVLLCINLKRKIHPFLQISVSDQFALQLKKSEGNGALQTWMFIRKSKPAIKGLIHSHCQQNDNKLLATFPFSLYNTSNQWSLYLLVMLLICVMLGRGQDLIEIIIVSLPEVARGL